MKYSCHVEPLGSSGVLTADSGKYPSSEYRSVRDEYVYLKENKKYIKMNFYNQQNSNWLFLESV
jgi:hypothetical protein